MDKRNRKRIKVIVVAGTRPEAIKIAPVIDRLKRQSDDFETIILATAQHRELLDQAFSLFQINPDFKLGTAMFSPGYFFDLSHVNATGSKT